MTLTAKDVAEITRLLEESSFDELYLEMEGMKLSLRRTGAPAAAPPNTAAGSTGPAAPALAAANAAPGPRESPRVPAPAAAASAAGRHAAAGGDRASAAAADATAHEVTAPLLGTFYRAPKPGAPPFVEVGAMVEDDTIIGIIEVMKLMNTVRAGVRGRVTEILARDGVLVEFGEPLLKVALAG